MLMRDGARGFAYHPPFERWRGERDVESAPVVSQSARHSTGPRPTYRILPPTAVYCGVPVVQCTYGRSITHFPALFGDHATRQSPPLQCTPFHNKTQCDLEQLGLSLPLGSLLQALNFGSERGGGGDSCSRWSWDPRVCISSYSQGQSPLAAQDSKVRAS